MERYISRQGRWHTALILPCIALIGTAVFLTGLGTRAPQPSQPPPDSLAARGQQVFVARKCYACHTMDEPSSPGKINLAESAGRDDVHLRRWLANPMAMKPRTIMPNQGLDGEEMNALIAFIRSLANPKSKLSTLKSQIPDKPASHRVSGWILHHGQELLKDAKDCFKSGCHSQRSFCEDCHHTRLPNSHVAHEEDEQLSRQVWMQQHGGATIAAHLAESRVDPAERTAKLHDPIRQNAQFCLTCHRAESDCDQCHAQLDHRQKRWVVHEPAGVTRHFSVHAKLAKMPGARCADCHTSVKRDCDTCHGTAIPHPVGYKGKPHRDEALKNPALCGRCHTQAKCDDCHFQQRPQTRFQQWTHRNKDEWLKFHDDAAMGLEQRCNFCHLPGRPARAPRAHRDCNGCHGTEMPHPPDWTLIAHGEWLSQRGIDSSRKIHGGLACFHCHTPQTKTYCDKCHDPSWRTGGRRA
jgi:cytochrome c2